MSIDEFIEKLHRDNYEKWKMLNPESAKILTFDCYMKDSVMAKHIEQVRILMKRGEQILGPRGSFMGGVPLGVPLGYLKTISNNPPAGFIHANDDGTFSLLHPLRMTELKYPWIKSLDDIGLCDIKCCDEWNEDNRNMLWESSFRLKGTKHKQEEPTRVT